MAADQAIGVAITLDHADDEAGRRVWTFPPLDRRAETDPTWATLDTLPAPRHIGSNRSQSAPSTNGWAAYKVGNGVKTHEGWGLGSYCFLNVDPTIHASRAFEVPVLEEFAFDDARFGNASFDGPAAPAVRDGASHAAASPGKRHATGVESPRRHAPPSLFAPGTPGRLPRLVADWRARPAGGR